ncbi:Slp family lipoprotein [uncultured Nitrospira sp.]|uniref:Slp family lipoprotein n=1 Tax=uncultured Nitrospira sp. TaxID=157176 RepID=UPI00314037CD
MTYSRAVSLSPVVFRNKLVFLLFLTVLCAGGCSTPYQSTLPPNLAEQIDPLLMFPRIKDDPDSFKGKLVILGGQILAAKRLQNSTQLTILQLPLIDDQEPTTELTQSQGRFIAEQQQFLDPATVPPGSRITLAVEISGSVQQSLDEDIYTYPTFLIKHFKIWPAYSPDYDRYRSYPQPLFYPYAYPYWRGYGRFYPSYPFGYW